MLDAYTLSIIIFALIVGTIIYKDRKNIEHQFIFVMRKTKRGRKTLIKISQSHPRFWRYVGNIGVITGFSASIYIFYALLKIAAKSLMIKPTAPTLSFLLPSLSSETVILPGIIAPPFWDWIISIVILVVVHEGFHGIMAAADKIRIKSLGWGFLAVLPLAFVEPDEKQLAKKPAISQLRVFAAGSFANIITAVMFSLILSLITSAFFTSAVFVNMPIDRGNKTINRTVIIAEINNYTIKNSSALRVALNSIGPNKTIDILVKTFENKSLIYKNFILRTTNSTENFNIKEGRVGINPNQSIATYSIVKDSYIAYETPLIFFKNLLFFIVLINIGVGLANLLPIKPLDGGRMWEILFKKITPGKYQKATKILTYSTLFILVLNFVLPWI